MRRSPALLILSVLLLWGCASRGPARVPMEPERSRKEGWSEKGDASWYGHPYHGRKTASGETYDMYDLTAAHRSLPFGTRVRVRRRDTGQEVVVRVNDRGPFIRGRIIDLSYAAAKKIHLDIDGVAPVKITVVETGRNDDRADPESSERDHDTGEADGCFWIQVGAFSDSDHAAAARRKLEKAGEKALIIEGPGGLERVRCGPWNSREDAIEALGRLRHDWPSARLVECGG